MRLHPHRAAWISEKPVVCDAGTAKNATYASRIVQHYHIWFDLRPGTKDLDFVDAMDAFLGHMKEQGTISGWNLSQRMLGLSSAPVGTWHVDIQVNDLAQLQEAFDSITPRTGKEEKLHAGVWSRVQNLQFALYRDFPDANRER